MGVIVELARARQKIKELETRIAELEVRPYRRATRFMKSAGLTW